MFVVPAKPRLAALILLLPLVVGTFLQSPALAKKLPAAKIFGTDDRQLIGDTTQFPWSAVGMIEAGFSNGDLRTGTGVMIGNKTVLTVAHVVYDASKGWATRIYFVPGKNGSTEPFGQIQVLQSMALDGWTVRGDDNYDIALLVLDASVGKQTGYFKIAVEADSFFGNQFLSTSGYPGDLGSVYQYFGTGSSYGLDGNMVLHNIDTEPGQSGAPIWTGNAEDGSARLVALMKGTMETTRNGNTTEDGLGTRITQEFANWINDQMIENKDIDPGIAAPLNPGLCSGMGSAGLLVILSALTLGGSFLSKPRR
jgi:V8-like Glu-specific endopeptidase